MAIPPTKVQWKRGNEGQVRAAALDPGEIATDLNGALTMVGIQAGNKALVGRILFGPAVDRPIAGCAGRLFYGTDSRILYLDTATTWVAVNVPFVEYERADGTPDPTKPQYNDWTENTFGVTKVLGTTSNRVWLTAKIKDLNDNWKICFVEATV